MEHPGEARPVFPALCSVPLVQENPPEDSPGVWPTAGLSRLDRATCVKWSSQESFHVIFVREHEECGVCWHSRLQRLVQVALTEKQAKLKAGHANKCAFCIHSSCHMDPPVNAW